MPLLRPGIDVAVHTEFEMLSPAAWLDFKQRIIRGQARGDRVATLRLWQSVGMVLHLPPRDGESAFEVPGLPPILLLPCTEEKCQRCRDLSDSRGLASGLRGMCWLEMVRVPPLFGTVTIDTMMSSIFWASRWRAAAGRSETWLRPRYGRWPTLFVAPRVAMWTSRCSWWPGGAGRWGLLCGWTPSTRSTCQWMGVVPQAGQWPIGWGGIGMGRRSWAYLACDVGPRESVEALLCSACRVVSVSSPLPRHGHAATGHLRPAGDGDGLCGGR